MNETDKCRRLAEKILSFFKDGITLDVHTRQYMDACLSGMSIEEVARGICDAPDLEIAPLMDLLFFPDRTLQIRLESLIEKEVYNKEDEAKVVTLLEAESIQTTLRDAENSINAALRVPTSVLAPFVRRLGITRHIPDPIVDTISSTHPPETAIRLKVMLRNTRVSFSRPVTDFIVSFFTGMESGDNTFDACLELLLALLEDQSAGEDPFHLLRRKTDALYRAREAALLFEKQLQRSNMETLMQQGIRAPEISAGEAEKRIALLDRIANAVTLGGCIARRRD